MFMYAFIHSLTHSFFHSKECMVFVLDIWGGQAPVLHGGEKQESGAMAA